MIKISKNPFSMQKGKNVIICVFYTFFFMVTSCQKSIDIDKDNPYYYNDEGKKIVLKLMEEKIFLQFSPNADLEQLYSLISSDVSLQMSSDIGLKEGYWGKYIAVLESKDGNPIPPGTFEYFKEKDEVVSISYLYHITESLQETYKGLTNEFTVKLKKTKSYSELQQLADLNHCYIGEENPYDKNQYSMYVSKASTFNALQISNMFFETNLFDWVQPFFYILNPPYYQGCDDGKKIIKVLKNEPAFVRKHCFEHVGRVDAFYFELVKDHSEFNGTCVFPLGEVPQQYRDEGMSVKISGNVINCSVTSGCIEPHLRLSFMHLFEQKSIEINK